ncbi:MarR family transcriptional regulator [Candidatus Pacearchaeota archaeon]|nr:MarR family transcriptional regulator [Candidatus Pacearchaeota archaeon]
MKNKNVGLLVIGIALIMGFMIFIFNQGMASIVKQTCSHGPTCSMYGTITTQTYVSMGLAALIAILGIYLYFSKPEEKIIIKKIKHHHNNNEVKKFNPKMLNALNTDEKEIMNLILKNKGNMYQSKLVQFTDFNKVKITRILDGLEGKGLIERKRRGMTNMVILKN